MNEQTLVTFVWLIPLLPLLAFFTIMLFTRGRDRLTHTIAIGAMVISFVLAQIIFWNVIGNGEELAAHPIAMSIPWLPQGLNTLNMGVLVDPLTAAMLFMVPLACLMIFIYSVGYSNFNKKPDAHDQPGFPPHQGREPMYSRFFAFLSLFAGAMLTLVVADNLLLLFIGWEVMGLCSYLLIGFWYARTYPDPKKITPRQAAVKAFMTTRVADVFMLLGIAFLYSATGTLSFQQIFTPAVTEALGQTLFLGIPVASVIYMLLFIGTIGKSAQFPLHTWLPDAMEGPTPVSAMIHAAAMVSAGVYMVIRMFPLISGTVPHGELVTFSADDFYRHVDGPLRRHDRVHTARREEGAGVLDDFATGFHGLGAGHGRVGGGDLPPDHARLLQGAAVHGLRLDHSRGGTWHARQRTISMSGRASRAGPGQRSRRTRSAEAAHDEHGHD